MINREAFIAPFESTLRGRNKSYKKGDYIYAYEDLEAECKVDAKSIDVELLAACINDRTRIDGVVVRDETHKFYKNGPDTCAVISNFEQIDENGNVVKNDIPVIKLKNGRILVKSPNLDLPVLFRIERKFAKGEEFYDTIMDSLATWEYLGTLQKEAADVAFWLDDYHFTMTAANGYCGTNVLSQLEIEFDGYAKNKKEPSITQILKGFDDVFNILPVGYLSYLTTTTKAEWLAEYGDAHVRQ